GVVSKKNPPCGGEEDEGKERGEAASVFSLRRRVPEMGIEVLALSLPSPTSQWDRLSSSHQASTRGINELGSLERGSSCFTQQASFLARTSPQQTHTARAFHHCGIQTKSHVGPVLPKKPLVVKHHLRWHDPASSPSRRASRRHSSSSEALLTSETQETSTRLLIETENVGVLLLNLGGPETLEDVQPFLFNLFSDPAEELRKSLIEKKIPAKVYVGMRYWHPFTEEAIEQVLLGLEKYYTSGSVIHQCNPGISAMKLCSHPQIKT
ncbi:hypothetical protein Taro_008665, partial [Colocasia esculenta]|nr:hypothetical protein [Colocasia esculenta]